MILALILSVFEFGLGLKTGVSGFRTHKIMASRATSTRFFAFVDLQKAEIG